MAKATNKADLLKAANDRFTKLWELIGGLPTDEQEAPFTFEVTDKMKEAHWRRDLNLRDTLAHLYEWHGLLLNRVRSNQNGVSAPFLPEPYKYERVG